MRYQIFGLGMLCTLAACTLNEMPQATEGRVLFVENCAGCHGMEAQGGAEWASLQGKNPPDLTTLYARGFDRAQVLSKIDGYTRASTNKHQMPEFGLLLKGESVPVEVGDVMSPVPRPLAALLAYLESIQVE